MEKRLLYLCNRVFWPVTGGHETEMYHYCRGLHDVMGYQIDVLLFEDEKKVDPDRKPAFIDKVMIAEPIRKTEKIANILFKSLFGKDQWPLQCSLYYSESNSKMISQLTDKGYDVIFVDMIRLAPYYFSFKDFKGRKILDIDDCLSKRYRRQLDNLDHKTMIAGQYNERLPLFLQKILRSMFIKRTVLNLEIPRMEKAESYYSDLYDKVIFASAVETEEFNRKKGNDKAVNIPVGVDYEHFCAPLSVKKEEATAVYTGNLKTAANADSVRMIVNKVLPLSKRIKKLLLVGDYSEELAKEFAGNERIEFIGHSDDVREYVKRAAVFLSPLVYGTGIKTKILEAMAMGVPVVTNSIGVEGIPGQNNEHWLASDDHKKLAEYADHLIDDKDEAERIA
ncbi:MAG: glycosyltransferase, partial [Erysipelotrichaceae bacterium]|nr:glycosyltransferase [Erysipelotrichaceae bacterium]